jgi:hypothetical protein
MSDDEMNIDESPCCLITLLAISASEMICAQLLRVEAPCAARAGAGRLARVRGR